MRIKILIVVFVLEALSLVPVACAFIEEAKLHAGNIQIRVTDSRGRLVRRYIGNYSRRDFTLYLVVNSEDYNLLGRLPHDDLGFMIQHAEQEELKHLVAQIRELSELWKLDNSSTANLILAIVAAIPYKLDSEDTDFPEFYRYATETLVDGAGDCEDTTILAAALFRSLGYRVMLINPPGHIALGIAGSFRGEGVNYKGVNYYFAETTATGWKIGELPEGTNLKESRIIEIGTNLVSPRRTDPRQQITPKKNFPIRIKRPDGSVHSKRQNQNRDPKRQRGNSGTIFKVLVIILIIGVLISPLLVWYFSGFKKKEKLSKYESWKSESEKRRLR